MTYDNPGRSFTGRYRASRGGGESSSSEDGGSAAAAAAVSVTLAPTDVESAFSRYDDTSDGTQHIMMLVDGRAAGQWRWVTGYAGAGRFLLDRCGNESRLRSRFYYSST